MPAFPLEKKVKQLEEIEAYFQGPEIDLEKGIAKHQEAVAVGKEILEYLEQAETAVKEIDASLAGDEETYSENRL